MHSVQVQNIVGRGRGGADAQLACLPHRTLIFHSMYYNVILPLTFSGGGEGGGGRGGKPIPRRGAQQSQKRPTLPEVSSQSKKKIKLHM